jgi:hypothetical protein
VATDRAAVDAYVAARVDREVSARFKDQNAIVRELGDKAEDVVWKRLTRYGVIVGALLTCILGFLTFAGLNTLNSVSTKIEPLVSAAEKRAKEAKQTVGETASRTESAKADLDRLSKNLDEQNKRVAERGGEISRKLDGLESSAASALRKGEAYRRRSEELLRNFEQMAKTIEVRVSQVSKQVDNLSIRRAYPTLGESLFVTYAGGRWKGLAAKSANEQLVNVAIAHVSVGKFAAGQVEGLINALKLAGYTPLPGMFGVDGPYAANFEAFGKNANETGVFYFKRESERFADAICAIVTKSVPYRALKPSFVAPSAFRKDDPRRLILEQSGLDIQIFLR